MMCAKGEVFERCLKCNVPLSDALGRGVGYCPGCREMIERAVSLGIMSPSEVTHMQSRGSERID